MSRYRSAWIAAAIVLGSLLVVSPAEAGRGDKTPPTAPSNLRITASTATTVSLAWDAASEKESTWWYCVQTNGSGCIRVDPPQTTLTRVSLMADRTFTFSVYAVDKVGNRSANSNSVSFTTPPDTSPPSPPPTLSLTSVFPTRISVSWTKAVDNTTQVWYTLLVNGSTQISNHIGLQGYTLLRLTPETTYELQVTARDAYFNTSVSNVLSVTTPAVTDTQPPTAPTNLSLGFQSDAPEIWLNWTQSTDDTDPQSQILYDVYLNGVRTDDGVIGWGSTVSYCRAPGPTEVVLRAVDTSGNVSEPSNALQFPC